MLIDENNICEEFPEDVGFNLTFDNSVFTNSLMVFVNNFNYLETTQVIFSVT